MLGYDYGYVMHVHTCIHSPSLVHCDSLKRCIRGDSQFLNCWVVSTDKQAPPIYLWLVWNSSSELQVMLFFPFYRGEFFSSRTFSKYLSHRGSQRKVGLEKEVFVLLSRKESGLKTLESKDVRVLFAFLKVFFLSEFF